MESIFTALWINIFSHLDAKRHARLESPYTPQHEKDKIKAQLDKEAKEALPYVVFIVFLIAAPFLIEAIFF